MRAGGVASSPDWPPRIGIAANAIHRVVIDLANVGVIGVVWAAASTAAALSVSLGIVVVIVRVAADQMFVISPAVNAPDPVA